MIEISSPSKFLFRKVHLPFPLKKKNVKIEGHGDTKNLYRRKYLKKKTPILTLSIFILYTVTLKGLR